MSRKTLFAAVLIVFSQASAVAEESRAMPGALDDFIQRALNRAPAVAAKKAEYEAARSRVFSAWLPEDPEAGIDVEGQPDAFDLDGRANNEYSLEQKIPFPTKLVLRGVAASKEAGILYGRYKEEEREIVRRLVELYFDIFIAKMTLQNLENESQVFDQVMRAAQGRYETGPTLQEDLLKIEIERKRGEIEVFRLRKHGRIYEERLSRILGHPLETQYALIEPASPGRPSYALEAVEQMALKNRPELVAFKKGLERAAAQSALERSEWLPDLTFRYEGREPRGAGEITEHDTFIGFTVPVWSILKSIGGKWKAAGLEEKAARILYEDAKKETLLFSHEIYAKLASAENALVLHENSILPAARQQVDAALSSYESGKGSFLNLIDALRAERQAKRDYYQNRLDYETARIEIELLKSSADRK